MKKKREFIETAKLIRERERAPSSRVLGGRRSIAETESVNSKQNRKKESNEKML